MATISGIDLVGAHAPREQKGARAAADYGAALSHREMVQEKLRVDPPALAEKKRAARAMRPDDEPPPRESARAERFAEEDAEADARHDERMGQNLDIEV